METKYDILYVYFYWLYEAVQLIWDIPYIIECFRIIEYIMYQYINYSIIVPRNGMCVCACVHVYIGMFMYVCMHECVCICMHVCMYVCLYVCMYVRTYVCMYVCMYACMYACMYVYMHVCVYMYVCMYVYICISEETHLNRVVLSWYQSVGCNIISLIKVTITFNYKIVISQGSHIMGHHCH